jgi:hypothetical protein
LRSWKNMTRMEKAVKIVSDLHSFYGRIPRVSDPSPVRDEQHHQGLERMVQERELLPSESPLARSR